MYPGVKLETALASYAFPTEKREIDSYVSQLLQEKNATLVERYHLQAFPMQVQSIKRTYVDKVFALCDYYLDGKSKRYSRHLYDIYVLSPHVIFDEELRQLIKEVREHRAKMSNCPSAQPGIDVAELLMKLCQSDFYREDYENITSAFVNEPVKYEDTIVQLRKIAASGFFS